MTGSLDAFCHPVFLFSCYANKDYECLQYGALCQFVRFRLFMYEQQSYSPSWNNDVPLAISRHDKEALVNYKLQIL
jgi:hypothetical protein